MRSVLLDPTGAQPRRPRERPTPAVARRQDGRAARHQQAARQRVPRPHRGAPGRAGHRVERFAKPTFTKPAPIDLRHEIATQCDVVIEALAD